MVKNTGTISRFVPTNRSPGHMAPTRMREEHASNAPVCGLDARGISTDGAVTGSAGGAVPASAMAHDPARAVPCVADESGSNKRRFVIAAGNSRGLLQAQLVTLTRWHNMHAP